jgi:bifunctional non-homologous end joining protein LigD
MGEAGVPDFNALQNAIDTATSDAIEYFVFDLPFHGGRDLRQVSLASRRALLQQVVARPKASASASARAFRQRRRRCSKPLRR